MMLTNSKNTIVLSRCHPSGTTITLCIIVYETIPYKSCITFDSLISRQTMTATIFEHLSVELFYEIFIYFHLHEVVDIFSNLNSRFAAILNHMPLISVRLGVNGIAVTEFYYTYSSQLNVSNRLFRYVYPIHWQLIIDYD